MLGFSGFNGFDQLSSVIKLVFEENLGDNNGPKEVRQNCFKELFIVNDIGFINFIRNPNIVFSWSYSVVYQGDLMWLCGFNYKRDELVQRIQTPNGLIICQMSCNRSQAVCLMEGGGFWMYNLRKQAWKDLTHISNTEQSEGDIRPESIEKVCCGETVMAILTKRGKVYNSMNKLSLPGVKIVDVACGRSHILMLSDRGEVFSVGEGSRGQLGHGELENEEDPRLLEGLAGLRVVAVSCGGWHSHAVTADGDLYSWGWNMAGQLGLPAKDSTTAVSVQALPQVVDWLGGEDVRVSKVACGSRHTLALLDDGSVWGCGWNAYGQLALPGVESTNCMTKLPTPSGTVKGIICGPWNSLLVAGD